MNKYGYCKAKDKNTGKWIEGYYACLPYTTYCFSEDYKANSDNGREYVVGTRMTDWGLPNVATLTEIQSNSAKRYIGTDRLGRKVFDGDRVVFVFNSYGTSLDVHITMCWWEWVEQTYGTGDIKSMWQRERGLWLCDGQLVLEDENGNSNS